MLWKLKKKNKKKKKEPNKKKYPSIFIGLIAVVSVVKMENSIPNTDKIYCPCVEESEMLGHPSEALGVLVWHKGMHRPIVSPLSPLTLGTGAVIFCHLKLKAKK